MKALCSLILCVILCGRVAFAQDYSWMRAYSFGQRSEAHAIELAIDGGYVVGITSHNYIDREAATTDAITTLLKIDPNGDSLWSSTIQNVDENRRLARDVARLSDNRYLVVGERTSRQVSNGRYDDARMWLASFSSDGDLLWEKALHAGLLNSVVAEPSGGATIGGRFVDSSGMKPFIVRIDATGRILAEQVLQESIGHGVASMIRSAAGEYVLAVGGRYLLKLGPEWDRIWEKRVGENKNGNIWSLIMTSDGDYLGAGISTSGLEIGSAYVVETDSSGGLKWEETIAPPTPDDGRWFNVITEIQDGLYVAAGSECIRRGACPRLFAATFEGAGSNAAEWHLSTTQEERVNDAITSDDGGLLLVGERSFVDPSPSSEAYLVEIAMPQLTSTARESIEAGAIHVSAYPNPTSGELTLAVSSRTGVVDRADLYDASGRRVKCPVDLKQIGGSGDYTLDVSCLSAGVYFISVISDMSVHRSVFVKL